MAMRSVPKAKKRLDTKPTVSGFLPYGQGDMFPQTFRDVINDSDTASAAIRAIAEFIVGNGFTDRVLANMIVNRFGETLDQVLDVTGWNIAEGEVITLAVGYNGLGKTSSIRAVPWEMVRLVEPNEDGLLTHAGIFPYLDNSFKKDKKKEHTLLPLFNPDPEIVLSQIEAVGGIHNYYGQLIYIKTGKPSADYYSTPELFGTVKNIETEKELSDYDFSISVNGFNTSGIWKQLKKRTSTESELENPDDTVSMLEEHQGGENGGKLLIYEAETKEELDAANFVPTTGAELADRYTSTNDRVSQRIARRSRVPNEIINIRRTGGIAPTGDEMIVASQMMQQTVNKAQRAIERAFSMVMQHWYQPLPVAAPRFNIENLNYFTTNQATTNGNSIVAQPG